MTGMMPPELDVPDMPDELSYLWGYYLDLKAAGDVNYMTIKNYSDCMAINLQPNEFSIIMDFEKEYKRVV